MQRHCADAWRAARETGNYDSLVTAYRGHPPLLVGLAEVADAKDIATMIRRANDVSLARDTGIPLVDHPPKRGPLTPRETEVMNLVASGLSNKEAAKTLVVAEATIKAHLRHAYEKMGVRGRTEAVAKWLAPG